MRLAPVTPAAWQWSRGKRAGVTAAGHNGSRNLVAAIRYEPRIQRSVTIYGMPWRVAPANNDTAPLPLNAYGVASAARR